MPDNHRSRSNQRGNLRKAVLWSGTLATSQGTVDCRIINISTSGAKVRATAELHKGEHVTLAIRNLGEFHSTVVWVREGHFGLHFVEQKADADTGEAIEHAASAEPPQPAEEPDAREERTLGAEPSAATKPEPPATPAPTSAPAPTPAPEPASASSWKPAETLRKAVLSAGFAPSDGSAFALDPRVRSAIAAIHPDVNQQIDPKAIAQLSRADLRWQLVDLVNQTAQQKKMALSSREQDAVVEGILNEMVGLGPLEPLLADDSVTDILVNGAKQVYVERKGKLELTGVAFNDDKHVLNIALRIATRVGRRIDESSPMVDARLSDGSRVNVIAPPLALVGPMISIRKFAKKEITLDIMAKQRNLSPAMATVLGIAARCRLNVLISGGTGSGKTTLLNAMSQMIDPRERVITIEDAAELQLQLPHVGGLETRIANLEGKGEITMRDLLKNALRMRPDRIILGEIRGAEAFEMLQAMNTGHEGSLGTIHASGPREALSRLESIIAFAGLDLPSRVVRNQIASAIDLVVQVSRMRDGKRRIIGITELTGMEGDTFLTQDLFTYVSDSEAPTGQLIGRFISSGLRPHFTTKAQHFGQDRLLLEMMALPEHSEAA
ncbi:MAG TPA: ATPase, T2SS/T4P/T4SS family [Stellaceae bacterium]|nr:ATPase, T2SS/T4P/T4SS family [Stellaceae bacterium]